MMQAVKYTTVATLRRVAAQRAAFATAAADLSAVSSSGSGSSSSSGGAPVRVNLANVEAQWAKMGEEERVAVHDAIEAVQVKDWKELSLDEKKAAYFVAFGPHGSRAPIDKPGDNMKIWASVAALVAAAGVLSLTIRQFSNGPAATMTKEWQEASNKRALELKLDPISGISSEGYKGPGFVQSK